MGVQHFVNKKAGTQYSVNPYFEAGTATPFVFAYRNEGKQIQADGLVCDISTDITNDDLSNNNLVENSDNLIVTQQGASGIQGFTMYQANVQAVELPDNLG